MEKSNNVQNFNWEALEGTEETEDMHTRLCRLWKTASAFYVALPKHLPYIDENAKPYTHLNPTAAFANFNTLLVEYEKTMVTAPLLDKMVRETDVEVSLTGVVHKKDNQDIEAVSGFLEELSDLEISAYMCADILCLYTEYKEEEKRYAILMREEECKEIDFPFLPVYPVRQFLNDKKKVFPEAWNAIYTMLKNPLNFSELVVVIHEILKYSSMVPFREVNPDFLDVYTKYWRPGKKALKEAFSFKLANTTYKYTTDMMKVWRQYVKSVSVRGLSKKRGALSSGYYRYNASPHMIKVINKVTDLIAICKLLSYKAVQISEVDLELARILIYNGITVYCPMSSQPVQTDISKIGLYSKGKNRCLRLFFPEQQAPIVSGSTVTPPPPIDVDAYGDTPFLSYIKLPLHVPKGYVLYPSTSVAEGFCWMSNVFQDPKQHKSFAELPVLYKRFSQALSFRNAFIFTRNTYAAYDPCRNFFATTFVYPKVRFEMTAAQLFDEEMVIERAVRVIKPDPVLNEKGEDIAEPEVIPPQVDRPSIYALIYSIQDDIIDMNVDIKQFEEDDTLNNCYAEVIRFYNAVEIVTALKVIVKDGFPSDLKVIPKEVPKVESTASTREEEAAAALAKFGNNNRKKKK